MAGELTSVNAAQAIAKYVAGKALPALFGNLVMGNLVNRDFEPTLAQAGDTVTGAQHMINRPALIFAEPVGRPITGMQWRD